MTAVSSHRLLKQAVFCNDIHKHNEFSIKVFKNAFCLNIINIKFIQDQIDLFYQFSFVLLDYLYWKMVTGVSYPE